MEWRFYRWCAWGSDYTHSPVGLLACIAFLPPYMRQDLFVYSPMGWKTSGSSVNRCPSTFFRDLPLIVGAFSQRMLSGLSSGNSNLCQERVCSILRVASNLKIYREKVRIGQIFCLLLPTFIRLKARDGAQMLMSSYPRGRNIRHCAIVCSVKYCPACSWSTCG